MLKTLRNAQIHNKSGKKMVKMLKKRQFGIEIRKWYVIIPKASEDLILYEIL